MKRNIVLNLCFSNYSNFHSLWIERSNGGRHYYFGNLKTTHKFTPWRKSVIQHYLFNQQ